MTRPTRLYTGPATPSRLALILVALAAALAGCKGKEVIKPDPEQAKQLTDCRDKLTDKDKYIAKLQEENTRLQMQKGSGEIVVTIVGGNVTVKPGQAGGTLPIDEKAAAAGAQEFLGMVERSKGAIQKCYEQALKKSAGLASQKISLTVYATFAPAGHVTSSYSAPQLGEPFDGCFKQVSQKWTLKGSASEMTYRSVVELTPS